VTSIAIVLARGGSKRLPRKNVLEVAGKPMLAWTVEAAVQSGRFSRVLVSTDDAQIAELGRSFGAEVPFLREGAADDMSPSSEATLLALRQASDHWGERYDVVAQLMANCPLRAARDVVAAYDNFIARDVESQISCFRYGWMNPWWAAQLTTHGSPTYLFPEARLARSQDLPPLFCPSGAIWIARVPILEVHRTFYSPNHILHPMRWMSALDVDDESDLEMARVCFAQRLRDGEA
jgi:CMP-N-acetylneuraminic acid synthetase